MEKKEVKKKMTSNILKYRTVNYSRSDTDSTEVNYGILYDIAG